MRALVLLASAAALAACNANPPGGDAAFPDLSRASYRAEARIDNADGGTVPVVMIRSGNKLRMEIPNPEGQMAVVNNADSGESFVLMTVDGRTTAMQMSAIDYENPADAWNADMAATARRTGTCSVAGERGVEWTREVEGESTSACVTDDGIILRATEGGRTTWETTRVERGPQSADLFVLPPGVQVMDMSAIAGAAASAAASGAITPELCDTLRSSGAPADALSRAGC